MPTEPGKSTLYELPWPGDTSAPNGPLEFEELAKKLDGTKWLSQSLKPSTGLVELSADTASSTETFADLPGLKLEITPAVASIMLVTITATCEASAGANMRAGLNVDGALQPGYAERSLDTSNQIITVSQVYRFALTAAAHTIKVQGRGQGGTVRKFLKAAEAAGGCKMVWQLFAS